MLKLKLPKLQFPKKKNPTSRPRKQRSGFNFKNIFSNSKAWLWTAWAAIAAFFGRFFARFKPTRHSDVPKKAKAPKDKEKRRLVLFHERKHPRWMVLSVFIATVQVVLVATLGVAVGGLGAFMGVAKAYMDTSPELDLAKIENQNQTSFIYDMSGNMITSFVGLENRVFAPIAEIPIALQDAFIAIEDARFYSHNGVDYKRIAGALLSNIQSNTSQGGSTITQQLVKMRLLGAEQSYKRKLQEAYLATQLETEYGKQSILEAYLNTVPLGQSNYGVKSAAEDYFGKTLNELTLRECAMLAGITRNPTKYDPRSNFYRRATPETSDQRTDTVLSMMFKNGFIDEQQYDDALRENVAVMEKSAVRSMYSMPYFVEYAVYDVVTHLLAKRGLSDTSAERNRIENELRNGGYHIFTTVDPEIQTIMEDTVYNWDKWPKMKHAADALSAEQNPDGTVTQTEQPQAAAVVIDYRNGEIKGIVGGRNSPTTRKSMNLAYMSHMPVGSTIKPIAVYGPAIDMGASPATIEYNVPGPLAGWGTTPNNYGGGGYSGAISLRNALIKSLNVVAARQLMEHVSIRTSQTYLQNLGIKSKLNLDGPGLALGTSGITPLEMAGAFGSFGNKGEYIEPLAFTKVIDSNGNIILDADEIRISRQVFTPSTAWLVVDMMKDAVNKGTGSRAKFGNFEVAGKTGTNSDYCGVSFVGLTSYYVGSVWVGSTRYKPLYTGAQGGKDAAPLWQAFMEKIHTAKELENQPIIADSPEALGLIKVTTCGVSSELATDACAHDAAGYPTVTDWWVAGTQPTKACSQHVQLTYCSSSGKLAGPYCPQSTRTSRSALLAKANSALQNLDPDVLKKYFPNALTDMPSIGILQALTPSSPEYSEYYCTSHTAQWAEEQAAYSLLVTQATGLIANIHKQMEVHPDLPYDDANALYTGINELKDAINQGVSLETLQWLYDDLLATYQSIYW